MQSMQMQAITGKELEYIVDSISNEDLLIKQCAASAATTQNVQIQQTLQKYVHTLENHVNMLIQAMEQHQTLAPAQPQQ